MSNLADKTDGGPRSSHLSGALPALNESGPKQDRDDGDDDDDDDDDVDDVDDDDDDDDDDEEEDDDDGDDEDDDNDDDDDEEDGERPEQVVKRLPWFSGWEPGKDVGSPWVNCAGSLGPGSPRHCADVNIGSFPRVSSTCVFFPRFYWLVVLDFLASCRL